MGVGGKCGLGDRLALEIIHRHEPGEPGELAARLNRVFAPWVATILVAEEADPGHALRERHGEGGSDRSRVDNKAA